jgi:hypothetical protein
LRAEVREAKEAERFGLALSAPLPLAIQLSQSHAYALFTAVSYPVLTIFGVTLLSLTYRFFAVPGEGRPSAST